MACASCHPEAGDDGQAWTFDGIGTRRTQSLRGGILGTEPLHWNGDMADFDMLMNEVFHERMQGPEVTVSQAAAVASWLDAQPRFEVTPKDSDAVERGKALFESEAVGCASCHSGPLFTDNLSADVGTGAMLQVPALRGVSFRLPLMHDGCVRTLRDRFGPCAGGDAHGRTSQLSERELDDLSAYLEIL
jgi:mono/diheme cytochrome c family protein